MPELSQDLPWFFRFHDLMPYRVREVLLVSSPYDAFTLEADGRLTERLFIEYSELNLPNAPRITHASNGASALSLLAVRRFDLVITMTRLEDLDVSALAREVKAMDLRLPVILLGTTDIEIAHMLGRLDRRVIDGVFVWTGNASILMAIIKSVEDAQNVAHDTEVGDVRVILVVEDSVRRYSAFLTLLYQELMAQASSLVAEGVNEIHKVTRMRARPKILLATTFEEAVGVLERYAENMHAVLSDVRFPRAGEEDEDSGFELARRIREASPELPVLLQSAEPSVIERARDLGIAAVDKNSPRLARDIRQFVEESLGFGDFVFRRADRTEVARARDLYEMEDVLHTVPAESIRYHASHNHFSRWLMARTLFHIAKELEPQTLDDFGGAEGVRRHCIAMLRQARIAEQQGMITNFSEHHVRSESPFVRLGRGSIGGKARGLAFINSVLAKSRRLHAFAGLDICTPRTVAIGTDEFDRFVDEIGILERLDEPYEKLRQAFLRSHLSESLRRHLEMAWRTLRGPLAVRSSSLLEDAQFRPFAGIYDTYPLANQHGDDTIRFEELCLAVKAVYASTYSAQARAYLESTPYNLEDEKMGVIIQEMVGRRYGDRFYPTISGVAMSYNYYPVGGQRPDDGLVVVGLGLGQHVVSGGRALAFSPKSPKRLPQFRDAADMHAHTQNTFWALDMARGRLDIERGPDAAVVALPLGVAEEDGPLSVVGSVYDPADDVIRDDLRRAGPRVVSFNNILKFSALPLARALERLLEEARHGMGGPVEIEFAVDVAPRAQEGTLYVLQVRPQVTGSPEGDVLLDEVPREDLLACSDRALGHGVYRGLHDVLYVRSSHLDPARSAALAQKVGEIDAALRARNRPYVLIGPGRWGSSDPTLGLPVTWAQIAGVKIVIETSLSDRMVEPSQGSHFFHNLTSLELVYLSARHVRRHASQSFVDLEWLDAQPAELVDTPDLRHVHLESPLIALLDGAAGRGVLELPGHRDLRAGSSGVFTAPP